MKRRDDSASLRNDRWWFGIHFVLWCFVTSFAYPAKPEDAPEMAVVRTFTLVLAIMYGIAFREAISE